MAKKTKFKNDQSTISDTASSVTSETTSDAFPIINNDNTNTILGDANSVSGVNLEDDQFAILKYNIINKDDYVRFIELANVYNLFNGCSLNTLHKMDLICLIGTIIDKLYQKEREFSSKTTELNNKIQELTKKPETSFDKAISYNELLGTLGNYKSWN